MDPRIIIALQFSAAPLVVAAAVAIGRGQGRRTLLALAGAALVVLAAGVVYYDIAVGLRSQFAYFRSHTITQGAYILSYAYLIMAAGVSLTFAAAALDMTRAVQLRAWGWFAAMLLSLVLAGVANGLYSLQVPELLTLVNLPAFVEMQQRLNEGDLALSTPYFLLASLLTIVPPLVPLLFALRRDRPASAATTAAGAA
jgi:hypothetical protein